MIPHAKQIEVSGELMSNWVDDKYIIGSLKETCK